MGLTYRKEEQLRQMPRIKSSIGKSKDGKYLIHRTVISHVKPLAYYQAVLEGKQEFEEELEA